MANEKTLEILKEMKADSKAQELFKGMEKPASLDEAIAAYAQVAEKLGYGLLLRISEKLWKGHESQEESNADKAVGRQKELR